MLDTTGGTKVKQLQILQILAFKEIVQLHNENDQFHMKNISALLTSYLILSITYIVYYCSVYSIYCELWQWAEKD